MMGVTGEKGVGGGSEECGQINKGFIGKVQQGRYLVSPSFIAAGEKVDGKGKKMRESQKRFQRRTAVC